MTSLRLERHEAQRAAWPQSGRHVLAQYDDQRVVVYQAYRESIARHAVENGRFGGEFSFSRMSWVKPGFLWMMFRSGWATKVDQERVVAVWLRREGFDRILDRAVHSTFVRDVYGDEASWKDAGARSDVRLQWDPDHDAHGAPVERRAIQLGLRGATLRAYATDWIEANARRHGLVDARVRCDWVDPFSSAVAFDGWSTRVWCDRRGPPPVASPRTWLLSRGWRKAGGAVAPDRVPARTSAAHR